MGKRRLLFVCPKGPVTFWSFDHITKFIGKKVAHVPLGAVTVAAMFPEDEWDIQLIDLNFEKLTNDLLEWADFVAISAMIIHQESVRGIIDLCKESETKIIAGGPLFTAQPGQFKGVDHLILGEAEVTLPLFFHDLKLGSPKHLYASSSKAILSMTPIPRWDLLKKVYGTYSLQVSRGCPFDCEFCDIVSRFGRVPRLKSSEQVIEELQAIYDIGVRGSVFFVDDNLMGDKRKVKDILRAIIKWQIAHHFPVKFFAQISFNLADDEELLRLMQEAGFNKVFIGIETPNPKSLEECGKKQNLRDIREAIAKIHSYGMAVMAGLILGFDSDDPDTIFDDMIKFIQESNIVIAMIGLLSALPKTRLWDRLKGKNRLHKLPTGNNTDAETNIIPVMGITTLNDGYRRVIRAVYLPENYYARIEGLLAQFNHSGRVRASWKYTKAFLKSIWYIGVCSPKARRFYWRMLLKAMKIDIRAVAMAAELAVYGEHFRKVAEELEKE